jgi:hypothetical protein
MAELEKISKMNLRIIQNEIFARYGYKFIPGGEMDNYFKQQLWNKALHKKGYKFFTGIEKNINRIQQDEK